MFFVLASLPLLLVFFLSSNALIRLSVAALGVLLACLASDSPGGAWRWWYRAWVLCWAVVLLSTCAVFFGSGLAISG